MAKNNSLTAEDLKREIYETTVNFNKVSNQVNQYTNVLEQTKNQAMAINGAQQMAIALYKKLTGEEEIDLQEIMKEFESGSAVSAMEIGENNKVTEEVAEVDAEEL